MNLVERIQRARPAWMAQGSCATPAVQHAVAAGMVDFFPERGRSAGAAKLVCANCPVRQDCYEYAVAHWELSGIWGGTSRSQRAAERARRRAAEAVA